MRAATAVIGASLVALTLDAHHDGMVTSSERRHLASPRPASHVLHLATRLGERRVAGVILLGAVTPAAVSQPELLLPRVTRMAATLAGRIVLAHFVRRQRPPQAWWQETPTGFSFPSRHMTWATLAIDEAVRSLPEGSQRVARMGQVGLIGLVGISRVRLGVHWPTDVIAALLWTEVCRRGTTWFASSIAATGGLRDSTIH